MSADFLTLAANRFSVRRFDARPVEPEALSRILRAGQLAPTACNRQPQRILILQSEDSLARLRRCTVCHFNAPVALIVCYDKTEGWTREFDGKPSGDIDASIVTTHMMLEAAELGVGTTWVMFFDPAALRRELSIPDTLEPTAILTMGYPAPDAVPAPGHAACKTLDELVCYEHF